MPSQMPWHPDGYVFKGFHSVLQLWRAIECLWLVREGFFPDLLQKRQWPDFILFDGSALVVEPALKGLLAQPYLIRPGTLIKPSGILRQKLYVASPLIRLTGHYGLLSAYFRLWEYFTFSDKPHKVTASWGLSPLSASDHGRTIRKYICQGHKNF